MSEYRKMDPDDKPVPSPKKPEANEVVHDFTGLWVNDFPYKCPFCKHDNASEGMRMPFKVSLCTPKSRNYRGWLFWKRYCQIPGYHDHYHCSVCDTSWILGINTPSNVVGVLP